MSASTKVLRPRAAPPICLCFIADWVLRRVCLDRRDSALGCTCPDMPQKNTMVGNTVRRARSSDNTHSSICNSMWEHQLLERGSRPGRRVFSPCTSSCSSRDRGRTVCFRRSTKPFSGRIYSNRGRHLYRQCLRSSDTDLSTHK